MNKPQKEALRMVIRELLATELAALRRQGRGAAQQPAPRQKAPAEVTEESVPVASAEALTAFAQRICALAQDARAREEIESGRRIFRPRDIPGTGADSAAGTMQAHFENGLVSERQIASLAPGGCIRAGNRVCFTPLALDEIRRRRIRIERKK